jgi:hypothetical protein
MEAITKEAARKKQANLERLERERKQREFIAKCTLNDVVVDAANLKPLRGSKETTSLQTISGACPNVLGAYALRQFMISNKLGNYRGKSKGKVCDMIVERKKMKIWIKLCMVKTLMTV